MSALPRACTDVAPVIHDVVDGCASVEERADVAAHAASCADCAAVLGELTALRDAARALPPVPAPDLWKGIEDRIAAPVVPLGVGNHAPVAGRRDHARFAAAVALALCTGIAAYSGVRLALVDREGVAAAPDSVPHVSVVAASTLPPVQGFSTRQAASIASGDTALDRDLESLLQLYHDRRQWVDPATIAIVDRNLTIIDQAIKETRGMLGSDPRNGLLAQQLRRALESKATVLRTVALMQADFDR